jgi:glycosyltransferase involved in cell wall biosynthesis
MKVLWFTWKDMKNPLAGGAEVVNEELGKRLVADGHELIFIVGGFSDGEAVEDRDGFKIIRVGSRYGVYRQAYQYYKQHLAAWPDVVIDEVNTIPFFAKFYVTQKNVLFIHQLCREIWFYQMFFPLNLIGYLLEPLYLRLLHDRKVITVSDSTKRDLMRYGFKADNISIISEGIELAPVADLASIEKYPVPTILALGSVRPMKRTLETVKAFEIFAKENPTAELIVAGDTSGTYGAKVLAYIAASSCKNRIKVHGRVSTEQKITLMQRSYLISVTSVKEGWGLIVTEANSQGTPAVVYDVDGLSDSVRHLETGLVCATNTPTILALAFSTLLADENLYKTIRERAWNWSRKITFEQAYSEFSHLITHV